MTVSRRCGSTRFWLSTEHRCAREFDDRRRVGARSARGILWVGHLDDLSVKHSPKIDATIGWMVVVHDPDGLEIHLYSRRSHGIDQDGRSGYGRRA